MIRPKLPTFHLPLCHYKLCGGQRAGGSFSHLTGGKFVVLKLAQFGLLLLQSMGKMRVRKGLSISWMWFILVVEG